MKALCSRGYGKKLEKQLYFSDFEFGKLGPNQIRVTIHYAGINPADYKIIYGEARILRRLSKPFKIGFDLAGIVSEVGSAVNNFAVSDKVYSKVPWHQMGTIAEECIVDADKVALMPKNMNFDEAASIPLVGCTVLESFDLAAVKNDDRILIHAGSGGIGTFAIQYAKYLGAYVYTTTSTANVDWVEALGADRVIDYKKEDYREIATNLDFVYETLGGKYTLDAVPLIKENGRMISILGHHDEQTLKEIGIHPILRKLNNLGERKLFNALKKKNIYYRHNFSMPDGEKLRRIKELIENGNIKAVIDRTYSFNEAIEALVYLTTGRAKGKVVIKIKED
jgi:NADPH:quinone reductase-like Zn-dependent oxidoreductase